MLVPTQVYASTQCIACHSSTPDGMFVGLSWTNTFANNGDPAQIAMLSTDGTMTTPSFVSSAAATLLARSGQELPGSPRRTGQPAIAHAVDALQRLLLRHHVDRPEDDLQRRHRHAGAHRRQGHPGDAAFSHDGNNVVYASGTPSRPAIR